MQNLEWRTVDKSTWDNGAWNDEPDKKQWLDESTGYPCLIHRAPSGALCGYVGVAKNHPFYGKENTFDGDLDKLDVHGGITFTDSCSPSAYAESGICHVVEDGDNDDVWWLGFDCAHGGDNMPALAADIKNNTLIDNSRLFTTLRLYNGTYRDLAYVTAEVQSLAQQLKALEA